VQSYILRIIPIKSETTATAFELLKLHAVRFQLLKLTITQYYEAEDTLNTLLLSHDERHPKITPLLFQLTRLLVKSCHIRMLHGA